MVILGFLSNWWLHIDMVREQMNTPVFFDTYDILHMTYLISFLEMYTIYELQPKFRLMESSIRDIFIFYIELGLGKR